MRAGGDAHEGWRRLWGMLPEYRGRHIATMAARFFHDLEEMGFTKALHFPVNDANTASRGLAEAIGAHGRILYHCFDKHIEV